VPKAPAKNDTPFVFGNKKLPKTTAVINICPASLCPSALLGLCQLRDCKTCYGLREERVWANTCLPSRFSMMEYWDRGTGWSMAQDLIRFNATRRTKITVARVGECGDMRHMSDVERAEMLATYLAKAGILTYCYTARSDLDFSICHHLVVNGSGWMAHNRFQVAYSLSRSDDGSGWLAEDKKGTMVTCDAVCPGDCRKCTLCQQKAGRVIAVKLH